MSITSDKLYDAINNMSDADLVAVWDGFCYAKRRQDNNPIDIDDLVRYIIDETDALDNDEIQHILDQERAAGRLNKMVSLDNGAHYYDVTEIAEAMDYINEYDLWDALANVMDDDTRERVAWELAPCTNAEFLRRYLEIAPCNLVLG